MPLNRVPFRAALLALAAIAGLALPGPASAASSCANSNVQATRANLEDVARAVHCLVNRERVAHGLSDLRVSVRLGRAADRHSRDMVRRGYFAHVSPLGANLVARARRTGYIARHTPWRLAENLGWGSGFFATADSMVEAWMKSRGHRENILRRSMEHLGVGLAYGTPNGGDGLTATLLFGSRN